MSIKLIAYYIGLSIEKGVNPERSLRVEELCFSLSMELSIESIRVYLCTQERER